MAHQEIIGFYNRYRQKLYNIALRITGDSLDAEDVVQDTVIKYLRSSTGKLADQQVEAWLCKVCVRTSVDMLRVRKALKIKLERLAEEDSEEDCSRQWEDMLMRDEPREMISRIRKVMQGMPDGYRVVLSLLLFEGYDYAEAAQILQVEESTVRSQYLRGKRKLLGLINDMKD